MKIGIISDIHSNIYAFKACTEYLEKQGCKEYIFLLWQRQLEEKLALIL